MTNSANPQRFSILALTVSVAMAGCASMISEPTADAAMEEPEQLNVVDITSFDSVDGEPERRDMEEAIDYVGANGQPPMDPSLPGMYKSRPLTKNIGDYVKSITQDLVLTMDYPDLKTPIGITHFALLDSDLRQTNLLGRQMAESFIHEMHKFDIPVVDFKATDYIRVTDNGDFVLSRDYLELSRTKSIEYVLTGTLTKHQGGYLVNARIVNIGSSTVVATSQSLVPHFVVDALIPGDDDGTANMMGGVRLKRAGSE